MIAAMLGNGYSYHKYIAPWQTRLYKWLWGKEEECEKSS